MWQPQGSLANFRFFLSEHNIKLCFSASLRLEVAKEMWAEATHQGSLQNLGPVPVTGSGLGDGIMCSGRASSVPWSNGAGGCLPLHVPFCHPLSYLKSTSWVAIMLEQLSRLRTSREEPLRPPAQWGYGRGEGHGRARRRKLTDKLQCFPLPSHRCLYKWR